ncbi:TonB-dependent receptor plug domain-containing protein [Roseateles saccharophilus]|uniref:Iron complex outermembrane receptor protein n=1 Tax=Roseateles saccharophilus TaxID=304 RepID=A0A4V2VT24_ROSSA|nr:TonB-dependent receptor [Roseateles saccharophilus]MDG0832908.1 TonB-dependent receptor [Roseateles saccharophilus]TCV04580.1 iron complex outermembrane receptor protein [Roseateles saccharophilus]
MKNLTRFPLTTVVSACLLALPLLSQPALAQATDPGEAQADGKDKSKLDKVVVTGSNIRRISGETPSPVQTLSADDLKQSGYNSLSEVLQGITANNMGSLSQANASAFAAGGGGVSLRGLTVGATLVLINGHRMAPYPMPDDGERDFVDLSSIPFDAIERVEVLKDGASAVYGSDAMAGVVNVILKRSFNGTNMLGEAGLSGKGDSRSVHAAVTHGWGDYGQDGYNAYVALEYKQRNATPLSARPYLTVADWTPYGGANLSSGSSPYYELQPKTRNINLLGKFTKKISEDWEFNIQGSVFNSQATQVGVFNAYPVDAASSTITIPTLKWGPANYNSPTVGSVGPIPVPAAYANAGLLTLSDIGPQTQKADTTSYRLVSELSGTAGDWNIDASIGWTRAETKLNANNFLSASAFNTAVGNSSYVIPAAIPANPYARLRGVTAATYAALAPSASATSTSDLNFLSARVSRELVKLGGGPLSVGAGFDLIHKSTNEQFPAGFSSGDQSSPIYSFAIGSQSISAAYAEVVAPLTKQLEIDAAARVDRYNTYGSSATPKIGFKFTPSKQLTLRGTYAKGFRAPNAAEMGVSGSTSGKLSPVYDPVQQVNVSIPELQLSNPKLKPEKSDSYTLGVIFEPNEIFNFSLDYYDIKIKNQISSPGLLGSIQIAAAYDPANPTTSINNPYLAQIFRNPDGSMAYETYKFVNASQTHTNGVDLDMRGRFDLGETGKLVIDLSFTRVFKYDANFFGTNYPLAGTHGPGFVSGDTGTPQNRAVLTTTWTRGPLELTGTLNYTSGISVLDPSYGYNDCATALAFTFPSGKVPNQFCRVPSFTTFNLTGRYEVSKQLSVHGSIVNLFDRHAPYDLQTFGSTGNGAQYGGAPYNPALHQDGAIGRYFTVGASYTF